MTNDLNILAISYGRNLFIATNTERIRMQECAQEVSQYHMIVFTHKKDNLQEVITKDGLMLHPTNSHTKIHMFWDAVLIGSRLLKKNNYKWVITTQDPFESGLVGFILSWRYHVKLNIQEHGDFFSQTFWKNESSGNRIRFAVGTWLLRHADTVRVVSARQQVTMRRLGVTTRQILSLSVRIDPVPTVQKKTEKSTLQARYPEGSIIILSMARFVAQKNLSLLIRAFAVVYKENPESRLVLVGEGAQKSMLQTLVKELFLEQAVLFQEWTNTPYLYMEDADIYALSSNYEGWGRVLIEAMQLGTAIITTDVGCAGEVIDDGVHGLVVPAGNVEDFSQQLTRMVQDTMLRERLSTSAQKRSYEKNISSKEYAQNWAMIMKKTYQSN